MSDQTVTLNFSKGVDTKTDPWQLPIGEFSQMVNAIFQKGGLLQSRPGYGPLAITNPVTSYITTLSDSLVSIGTSGVSSFSSELESFITKSTLSPCSLSTLPLVRNNFNQTQVDSAIQNNLILTAYTQTLSNGSSQYLYAISNATTGQSVVASKVIPAITNGTIAGPPRTFVLQNNFILVSPVTVSGSTYLQYIAIPVGNPLNPQAPQNVTSEAMSLGWDAVVVPKSNALVLAYNTASGGQGVHVAALLSSQIQLNNATSIIYSSWTNASYIATLASVTVDTVSPYYVYVSFWNSSTGNVYTGSLYVSAAFSFVQQFAPTITIPTTLNIQALTSVALNGSVKVLAEILNAYSFASTTYSNRIYRRTISSAGSLGAFDTVICGLGLASKGFTVNGKMYFVGIFQSTYQPTYFVIDAVNCFPTSPVVVAKLAYENAYTYTVNNSGSTHKLWSVSVNANTAKFPYLNKDLVEALTTTANTQQTTSGGIYSQTGINLCSLTFASTNISTAETAENLHISGGFLAHFDGTQAVEHNFFLWPDFVNLSASTSGGSMTAQTYFYQATYEWSDQTGKIYRSAPSIPSSVTTTGTTSSVTINVPTLRVTMKIANPVKIVIYRWSSASQVYQQVTSVTQPLLNDPTADFVSFLDTQLDSDISSHNIIYTTGGAVENVNAPATNLMTVFDTRLVLVPAENPNTIWFSKQGVEGAAIDMSDLFTVFVNPNIGTTASTGPITAIAPMDEKLVTFKRQAIFFIGGVGPNDLGQTSSGCSLGNYSQPIFITSTVGCTNQNSIVLTPAGLFFQSDKGVWLLGRDLSTSYVGAPVEAYNSSVVTSAKVIPETNYVLFTLDSGEMLMYDYYYQQWGIFKGASAESSCIFNELHTILTPYGQILQQTPGEYLDNGSPVLMSWTSGWINLASLQGYQRFKDFYILANYLSPHSLLCQVAYDYNSSIEHSVLITPKNFSPVTPGPFGVPTPFGSPESKEQWRVHAKKQLCQSFQLTLSEVFNPALGVQAGAGFTMSGVAIRILTKKSTRPISGGSTSGLS